MKSLNSDNIKTYSYIVSISSINSLLINHYILADIQNCKYDTVRKLIIGQKLVWFVCIVTLNKQCLEMITLGI